MNVSAPPGASPANAAVPPPRAGRKRLLLIKGVITLALLVFLTDKLDTADLLARLKEAAPVFLFIAIVIVTLEVPLAAYRWMLLAQRTGAPMTFALALQLSFAGLFFGQVLPASIGGDVVRGVLAYRNGVDWQPLISSLVLDRIIALLAAVVLILAALPWLVGGTLGALMWTAGASALLVGVLIAGLFVDLLPLPRRLKDSKLGGAVLGLIALARRSLASGAGAGALTISILIHLMTIGAVVALGASLGLGHILLPSMLVVPTALIAAAVPVSLNGWGVREGVMVAGFALFGIAEADAFLVSVLLGFSVVLSALPGGFTWLTLK
ncbi:MAG: flippase-like domain-containing protein [Rhodospirillaceae bacterium]|nr:flippase-like domain-containing protein [Rhodospirillaceae bacterium]